jgi:hypothetical protein
MDLAAEAGTTLAPVGTCFPSEFGEHETCSPVPEKCGDAFNAVTSPLKPALHWQNLWARPVPDKRTSDAHTSVEIVWRRCRCTGLASEAIFAIQPVGTSFSVESEGHETAIQVPGWHGAVITARTSPLKLALHLQPVRTSFHLAFEGHGTVTPVPGW